MTHHYTSIYWNQFQCEICKSSLPYVFVNNGRKYPLIEIPVILTDHLVLESITLENKHSRMVHILHPRPDVLLNRTGKRYMMGRAQDCQLKMSDISVSRNHCQITFVKGKFRLQDCNSKFGTLVLNRGSTEVPVDRTIGIQCGRTLMILQTKVDPTETDL